MKSLQKFIQDFIFNKGHYVFLSLLIAKICGFIGSVFIIRILPENEFGIISFVASLFFIFMPFSGLGSHQILLRFGSVATDISEKKALSRYLFVKGFKYQILLSILFILVSVFYVNKYQDIFIIFVLFSIRLVGFYFFSYVQSEFRIFGNNRGFSVLNNTVNISGVILLIVLSYFFGLKGYLISIAISPFIALFWMKKEHFRTIQKEFNFSSKELWRYGIHASGTGLLSDALFSIDVLILVFLMNENAVANYKVALLIPANITFLAATFTQSDFPILAKNFKNKIFLKNYIVNYYKIFIPLSVVIFIVGFMLKDEILLLFFGSNYSANNLVFVVFLGGFCLNMLLRNLYGNLLSAVGMMKVNTYVSALNVILLVLFSMISVGKFGIMGMAISLCLSMILAGSALMFLFFRYLKDLK